MPARIPSTALCLYLAVPLAAQDLLYRSGALPANHQAAHDGSRNRLVLLGTQRDLHEWDGRRWLYRPMATTDFRGGALAFHAASGRTVAFGFDNGFVLGTFDWDGAVWRKLSPASSPPFRYPANPLAYDSLRGRIVLFGGMQPNGPQPILLADTWEWDGSNWLQRFPATSPQPRTDFAMSFDSARGVTVLFGGEVQAAPFVSDELWEWNGANWRPVVLAVRPPARLYPAMAFDAARARTVLFGGHLAVSLPLVPLADLWEYDGTAWTQVTPSTPWPAPRSFHTFTAAGPGELILAGGSGFAGAREVWSWNGSTWTARAPLAELPPQRIGFAMAADPLGGGAVRFGGSDGTAPGNETWQWDGSTWRLYGAGGPPPREGAAAWTHGASVHLFGGRANGVLNDTWRWNGSSWNAVATATSPPARHATAVAYDAARAQAVMFGGKDASGTALGDTWTFDGVNWQLRTPAASPSPRHLHVMAADPARNRVVLFGGYGLRDTWEWDGANWQQVVTPALPPAPASAQTGTSAAMAFDARQNRSVLVLQGLAMWTYDGVDWSPLAVPHQFASYGQTLAAAGWPTQGGMLIHDGVNVFELSTAPATVAGYGNACGPAPMITGSTRPGLGEAGFGVDVVAAPANAPLVLVGAIAPASVPLGPCTLLVAPGQLSPVALANPAGFCSLGMPVPAIPSLVGFALYLQVAALDPAAGLVLSAGLRATVGD